MAVFDAILAPSGDPDIKIAALAGSASSAEQVLGTNIIFAIIGTDNFHIRFGVSGMGAADNTFLRIAKDQMVVFDTSTAFDRIRVFNPTAAAIDVSIKRLSKL